MRVYFFGLHPMAKLVRSSRIIGGLRGNTAICHTGISILTLKNGLILLLLHPVSRSEDAVPILGVSQSNMRVPEKPLLTIDLLQQLMRLAFRLLAVLVKLLLVLLELSYMILTRTTKLFILRLYFSMRAGRMVLWYLCIHFFFCLALDS